MGNESSRQTGIQTPCSPYSGQLISVDGLESKHYDIENLAFSSGGAKAIAYAGAVKVLKLAGILERIKRFTGVGTGAIVAALLALGFECDTIHNNYNRLMDKLLIDDRIGFNDLSAKFPKEFGWNAGDNFLTWFGNLLESKSYDCELTFWQLYQSTKIELCILVTNLSKMCTMYCHPKSTPDMPIRRAVFMALSLPGIFIPKEYKTEHELCIDGSLTCSYPVHVFDGWWLSMDQKDSFLNRLDLSREDVFTDKFEPKNLKTLGFLLIDKHEEHLHKELVDRLTSAEAKISIPWTVLGRKHEEAFELQLSNEVKYTMFREACEHLFTLVEQVANDEGLIVIEEFANRIFREDLLDPQCRSVLLPNSIENEEACVAYLREICGGESNLSKDSIRLYFEKQALSLLDAYSDYYKTKNRSLHDFFGNIANVFQNNSSKVSKHDYARTVGIFCGYIGSNDINMESPDQMFLYKQGWNATALFLRELNSEEVESAADSS